MPSGREPIGASPNGRVKEDPVFEELELWISLFCFYLGLEELSALSKVGLIFHTLMGI